MSDPERLRAVTDTGLLHGGPDAVFDRVARLASALVGAPISFVTLVAGDFQVMPGAVRHDDPSDDGRHLPLDQSICPFAVATGEPLVIDDAHRSELVRTRVSTRSGAVSSYAGMPLRTGSGHVLGTLCVLDRTPRQWSEQELALLDDLAALAVNELDFRIAATRAASQERASQMLLERVDSVRDVTSSLVEQAERADDIRLQRYGALTRKRTDELVAAAGELKQVLAQPDPASTRGPGRLDLRAVTARALASARAATGSTLLEHDLPDVPVPLACDGFEIERSIAHLLVTALLHSDGKAAVRLRLAAPDSGDGGLTVLTLDAPGVRVPTGELSRVVARITAATCEAATVGSAATGATVQVSRGAVIVRSGTVEAHAAVSGTTVTVRWQAETDLPPGVINLTG